jgi:hypothetical protein
MTEEENKSRYCVVLLVATVFHMYRAAHCCSKSICVARWTALTLMKNLHTASRYLFQDTSRYESHLFSSYSASRVDFQSPQISIVRVHTRIRRILRDTPDLGIRITPGNNYVELLPPLSSICRVCSSRWAVPQRTHNISRRGRVGT